MENIVTFSGQVIYEPTKPQDRTQFASHFRKLIVLDDFALFDLVSPFGEGETYRLFGAALHVGAGTYRSAWTSPVNVQSGEDIDSSHQLEFTLRFTSSNEVEIEGQWTDWDDEAGTRGWSWPFRGRLEQAQTPSPRAPG
jgi:hypothetical protein